MTNDPRNRLRGMALVAGLCIGLPLAACHPKPPQAQPSDQLTGNDAKFIERMEKMRARAKNAPGGATEASDFAAYVTMLYTQGVAKRRSISPELVDEAVQCLDRASEAKPDDAPDLLIRKGELLLAADKGQLGVKALRESVALRPSLRAFNPLAKVYAAEKQSTELVALCKKTLPAMKSDESRYALLDDCLKYSGATAPEVGLGWAPPKELAFYKTRRRELEARLEAASKQRAKEERKEAKEKR